MTIRAPDAPAPSRGRRSGGRPFSVLDELNCYFDAPAEPNNVQLEAWLSGHLRPELLRAAVTAVLAAVPAARARRAAAGWWRAGYAWEFPPRADADPVSLTGWRDEAELDAARVRFLAAAPDLDRSPPFRLLLAQGPEWDSLILNAHHAAFDGRSCVRLLQLIADQYGAGRQRETLAPDPIGAPGPRHRPDGTEPQAGSGARPKGLPLALRNSARIASQHANGGAVRGAPGYGVSLLEWPGVPAPRPGSGSRATVNDLLIAALIETVTRWNTKRRRPPERIQISMPMDLRPPGHGDELGNLSRLCTVTVEPFRVADLTAAVAAQTGQAKSTQGPVVSPAQAAVARTPLPVPVKRGMARLALRSVGGIGCDTSLLSNLGNIADPPKFETLTSAHMWFSTSAHMPRGLSVGAVTVSGRLHLCFRYRNALLDAAAGHDFAAEYAAALSALADGGPGR